MVLNFTPKEQESRDELHYLIVSGELIKKFHNNREN